MGPYQPGRVSRHHRTCAWCDDCRLDPAGADQGDGGTVTSMTSGPGIRARRRMRASAPCTDLDGDGELQPLRSPRQTDLEREAFGDHRSSCVHGHARGPEPGRDWFRMRDCLRAAHWEARGQMYWPVAGM